MKFCIVMPRFITDKVGGVEIQTYLIGKYLTEFGWEVHFVAETTDPKFVGVETQFEGIHVHRVRRRLLFQHWRSDITGTLSSIRPDVIYQRGRSPLSSARATRAYAKRFGIPRIYHVAEDSDLSMLFPFTTWRSANSALLKKVLLLPDTALSAYFFSRCLRTADLVFAQTQYQWSSLQTTVQDAVLIRSGHEPSPPVTKDDPPVVFWISHAGKRKQPEIFIDLANALKDTQARFIMAGTIPDPVYRQSLLKKIESTSNLTFIGELSWQQSIEWFGRASILVNTTESGREGFPNTFIQAWFGGTPVVTLNCDPDDTIQKKELGFHSGSFNHLVRDVRLLIESGEMRIRMGNAARLYAMEHHDANKNTREIDRQARALVGTD